MCSTEYGKKEDEEDDEKEKHTHEHDWILCRVQLNEIDMI